MEEGAAIIELTKAIDGKISARPWVPLTTIIGVTRKVDARLFYVAIAAMNAIFAMAELMVQTIWDSHFHFVVFFSSEIFLLMKRFTKPKFTTIKTDIMLHRKKSDIRKSLKEEKIISLPIQKRKYFHKMWK